MKECVKSWDIFENNQALKMMCWDLQPRKKPQSSAPFNRTRKERTLLGPYKPYLDPYGTQAQFVLGAVGRKKSELRKINDI